MSNSRFKLIALVAYQSDYGIGKDNALPWHIPSDLKRFKSITEGKVVIMGRKTWESLPKRPLPNRKNIIISRSVKNEDTEDTFWVKDILSAIKIAKEHTETAYVIGGQDIYKQAIVFCDGVIATEIPSFLIDNPDRHFPPLYAPNWSVIMSRQHKNPGEPEYWLTHYINRTVLVSHFT